jgi:hypothetical protein
MAASFYISDGTNTVYFIGGSSELKLGAGGWNTESISEEFIWETIELISDNTDATVRAEKKKLDLLLYKARLFNSNPLSSVPVWLYFNADGESAKRSLVLDGSTKILSDNIYSPLMGVDSIKVNAAIKRKHIWENTSATNVSTTGLNVLGGSWLVSNDAGTENQRIESAFIKGVTAAKDQYWVGFRPIYEGTTGFVPLWECEDGINGTDASDAVDATASGGNRVDVSFTTTATLANRLEIRVDDIGVSNLDDFVGKYQILGRFKLDAGSTQIRVQLRAGLYYLYDSNTVVQDTIIDGETSWHLYELGEVQFPPMGNRDGNPDTWVRWMTLSIWAERLSTTGSLWLDALILIPSDHFFSSKADATPAGGGVDVYTNALDEQYAVGNALADARGNIDPSFTNWEYPIGGGLLVIAAQKNSDSTLTGTLNVELNLVPRWQSYRA